MRLSIRWIIITTGIILLAGISATLYTIRGTNTYPNVNKKHAMLRLEDIGPGGYYSSEESLGQLRAVLDELHQQHIPFQIALIPHWKSMRSDHSWYEKGLDQPGDDPYLNKFIHLLQTAEKQGALIGMHGYTHQYGTEARGDGYQNSAIGREFAVPDAPETDEASFAAEHIEQSLTAFERAGLHPAFWESPHYKSTREQEKVFRSYVGILYQPDFYSLRSFHDLNMYENENALGKETLGSVYVPAPLKYIHDGNSVEQVLTKAADYTGLASLYFHPLLEFSYLEPVQDSDGHTQRRDGLPEYRYKADASSPLQRLTAGMAKEGYRWVALSETVPFSPAHRVVVPPGTQTSQLLIGNFTGKGHADLAIRYTDRIERIPGDYQWPRNRPQAPAQVWLTQDFKPEDRLWVSDLNHDGKDDLVQYRYETGEVLVYYSTGQSWRLPAPYGQLPIGLENVQLYRADAAKPPVFIAQKGDQLMLVSGLTKLNGPDSTMIKLPTGAKWGIGHFQSRWQNDTAVYGRDGTVTIYPNHESEPLGFRSPVTLSVKRQEKDTQMLIMDSNGDGKSDLVFYEPYRGVWQVYLNKGELHFEPMDNAYGPWARGEGRIAVSGDFDGNGKEDIGSFNPDRAALDLSLSFQPSAP
ncbi:DUF2334 domain-containing protein [Paenibacillus rigui]|uniref:DUF2334 domain-containing protein n=1 Tax=Paenibacillus rigui TaxID=554312 RepID=A0A229UGU1_9BACL|nr:DUF2334 domain-containing protein [Paenibacillus rigui]OXM82565.1 hypothetical protein CF651_30235 [Paenibacillus rigui]